MQDGLISESRARPANLPAALQTTIASARAALDLKTNDGMRAHHLIAANVWAKFLNLATLAIQAGWQPDSGENLIALPADAGTQARGGFRLPIHNSSHRVYDEATRGAILIEEAKCGTATPTPAQARTIFENAAKVMEGQIRTGRWMPRLH
jgi:hypothetical protein